MNKKETIKIVLELTNKYALKHKGSLFVIVNKYELIHNQYERLYPNLFFGNKRNISEKGIIPVIDALTNLDGAFIIDKKGEIIDYGTKLNKTKVLLSKGTRHASALGISEIKGITSILSSEEDGQIRIFKEGKLIAEINPKTGENKKFTERLADLISKPELHIITAGGVVSLAVGLANPLLAVLIFTGTYVTTKYGVANIKDFIETGKIIIKKQKV